MNISNELESRFARAAALDSVKLQSHASLRFYLTDEKGIVILPEFKVDLLKYQFLRSKESMKHDRIALILLLTGSEDELVLFKKLKAAYARERLILLQAPTFNLFFELEERLRKTKRFLELKGRNLYFDTV